MNDSAIFQGLTRALSAGGSPAMFPMTWLKNMYFECPVAVASHLQRFAARQMQDQMQLMGELSKNANFADAFTKQAAFMQQSTLAWNTEMMELAELVQSKVLAAAQPDVPAETAPVARAA